MTRISSTVCHIGIAFAVAGSVAVASCRTAESSAAMDASIIPSALAANASAGKAGGQNALQISISGVPRTVTAREKAELTLDVRGGAGNYSNPYDPDVVAVDLDAVGPGQRTLKIPAFWNPDSAGGAPGSWRVRVNLPVDGQWTLTASVRDTTGQARSMPVQIRAAKAASPGFVRPATGAGKKRYFQFENGQGYFLVGENVCWSDQVRNRSDYRSGMADYTAWFSALDKAGANYARLWMAFSPIENKELGAGKYDPKNAAYFDQILELAEKHGLYCMLAFGTYGELRDGGYFNEGQWKNNPYNALNGGPVPNDTPEAFFTSEAAKKLYRQRLRYLIARYGAYRSLAFWEFWNEQGGPREWYSEMGRYMAQTDPYRHPMTTSYSTTGPAEIWQLPEMGLTQTHRYGDDGNLLDIATEIPGDVRAHDVYNKPHLLGESGITWRGPDTKFDPQGKGIFLHNGLWSSLASGAAGGAMNWWWDSYIHPKNVYHVFTGIAKFAKTVDWPNRAFEPIDLPVASRKITGAPVTFGDVSLPVSGEWGARAPKLLTLGSDGNLTGGKLPGFLYGPGKPELTGPLGLKIRASKPATLTVRVGRVSDKSRLVIKRNGKPLADVAFDASENGTRGYKSTQFFPEYGIYQAVFDKDVTVKLPAGDSTLSLENTQGDWLSITAVNVTGIVRSDVAYIRTTAIQDGRNGETIVWVQDPKSDWKSGIGDISLPPQTGIRLTVPVPGKAGPNCSAVWWDTRQGKPIQTLTVKVANGKAVISAPTFSRDIALHLKPKSR